MPARQHPPIDWSWALAAQIGHALFRFAVALALWLLRMTPTGVVLYGLWFYFLGPNLYGLFFIAVGAALALAFRVWRRALQLVTDLMVRR